MQTSRKSVMAAAMISALASAGSLQAHHSASMFDVTPIWLEGTVVRFDRINPHSIVTVEEKTSDGQVRRWIVEGPSPGQLNRAGIALDFLKTGDLVRVCVFPMREEFLHLRPAQSTVGVPARFVHGHMLEMKGKKSMWGSYGSLTECIRSSGEPRQPWLDFLNSDTRAHDMWCQERRRTSIQSTPLVADYFEEVDGQLTHPCRWSQAPA